MMAHQYKYGELLAACKRNSDRARSALEYLDQEQPGMPTLPVAWREWIERQLESINFCAIQAIDKTNP